jgi:DNA-binding MarR family transcriptional regulator
MTSAKKATAVPASPCAAEAARGCSAAGREELAVAPALSSVTGYLLRRAHHLFQTYWSVNFQHAELPITPVQAGMLVVLKENPGLSQTALARIMNVEGPTLLQSIDRLEHHGYVQRVRRPNDRRSYEIQMTARGRDVLAEVEAFLPRRDDDLLAELTEAEREQLLGMLSRIVAGGRAQVRALQQGAARDAAEEMKSGARAAKPRAAARAKAE